MTGVKRGGPVVKKKITLPIHIAGEIDLLLADELRSKPRYGALSQLITKLLIDYLARLKSGKTSQ